MRGKIIAILIGIPILLALVFAFAVIQLPRKSFEPEEISRMDFDILTDVNFTSIPRVINFTARDGVLLPYRIYKGSTPSNRKIYLLHDVGWHGMEFDTLARSIAYSGIADVIVPDLRGHGASPARRGAAEYPNQLVDDLADLIHETSTPEDNIIIGGYSFGGGLAINFAASNQADIADRYILFAPFLGFNSPVDRPKPDPWLQPMLRKIAGLKIFNAIGMNLFGDSIVLQLTYPRSFLAKDLGYTITREITWNMFTSFNPESVLEEGLGAMKPPVLVILARQDELFSSSQYKSVLAQYTDGADVQILENTNHMNLLNSPKILSIIQNWLAM